MSELGKENDALHLMLKCERERNENLLRRFRALVAQLDEERSACRATISRLSDDIIELQLDRDRLRERVE